MRFTIITHVHHKQVGNRYFAYGPYVREMNIWEKYAGELEIVAPLDHATAGVIDLPYSHNRITFSRIPAFNLIGWRQKIRALFQIPGIVAVVYKAMKRADHIHLRCPGNMGLIGCVVQILFPSKPKTAKYAGNWDPDSKQPLSYRLQKWLLSNTRLTRNMSVLVYGEWRNSSKNIRPFFTATYKSTEATDVAPRNLKFPIRFLFVGALAAGKQPLLAVQLIECLKRKGIDATLEFFGDGKEREQLEKFIAEHGLQDSVILRGNQNEATVREAYQKSHFLFLASKSEGWPKVVAEAMFWGTVPICTAVSCTPQMLDFGKRGILLQNDMELDLQAIESLIKNGPLYESTSRAGMLWSRGYTLDRFETEIGKLMSGNGPQINRET